MFICKFIQYYFFGRASAQLIQQLRLRTFKTLLRQEIGWFDRKENNSGRLSKLLESDAAKIQAVSLEIYLQCQSTILLFPHLSRQLALS